MKRMSQTSKLLAVSKWSVPPFDKQLLFCTCLWQFSFNLKSLVGLFHGLGDAQLSNISNLLSKLLFPNQVFFLVLKPNFLASKLLLSLFASFSWKLHNLQSIQVSLVTDSTQERSQMPWHLALVRPVQKSAISLDWDLKFILHSLLKTKPESFL